MDDLEGVEIDSLKPTIPEVPSAVPVIERTTQPSTVVTAPSMSPEAAAEATGLTLEELAAYRKELPEITTDEEFVKFYKETEMEEVATPSIDLFDADKYVAMGIPEEEYSSMVQESVAAGMTREDVDLQLEEDFEQNVIVDIMAAKKPFPKPTIALPKTTEFKSPDDPTQYDELTPNRIKDIAIKYKFDPYTQEGINAVYKVGAIENYTSNANQTLRDLDQIVNIFRPWEELKQVFGSKIAEEKLSEISGKNYETIVNLGKSKGLDLFKDPETNRWQVMMPNGQPQDITPTFLQSMADNKLELAGDVAGAVAGRMFTNQALRAMSAAPIGKAGTAALWTGSFLGALVGGVAGTEADYLWATIRQDEEFSGEVAWEKAGYKVQLDAMAGIVGGIFGTAFEAGGKGMKNITMDLVRKVTEGNQKHAAEFVMRETNLTFDEAMAKVAEFQKVINTELQGDNYDKILTTLAYTDPMLEPLLRAAASKNPEIMPVMRKAIADRTDDFREQLDTVMGQFSVESALSPSANAAVYSKLGVAVKDYIEGVNLQYKTTKAQADILAPDFTFNPDSVAISKIRDVVGDIVGDSSAASRAAKKLQDISAKANIDPKAVQALEKEKLASIDINNKFLLSAQKYIRDNADNPAVVANVDKLTALFRDPDAFRGMGNLIDIRQTLNSLKYSLPKNQQYTSGKPITAAIYEVDKLIATTMNSKKGGKQWLEDWAQAKTEYGTMKEFIDVNGIVKKINGENTQDISRALLDSAVNNKGVYQDLIRAIKKSSLPNLHERVELTMLGQAVEKHTAKEGGQAVAIDFVELSKELKALDMQTEGAVALKETVETLGNVFRAETAIAKVRNISPFGDSAAGNLATTVQGKAQMYLAGIWFERARAMFPNNKRDLVAAKTRLAYLLKNPLDAKVSEQLIKEFQGESQLLERALTTLQKEFAKNAAEGTGFKPEDMVKIYKSNGRTYTKPVRSRSASSGQYATGEIIPKQQIIGLKRAEVILGKPKLTREGITLRDKEILLDRGFLAVEFDDKEVLTFIKGN